MKLQRSAPVIVVSLLAAAALAALLLTRAPAQATAPGAPRQEEPQVDLNAIVTARRLAPLVASNEEKPFARDAQRVADHEVDLAFADALRQAAFVTPPSTAAVRELLTTRTRQEEAVEEGQRHLAQLTKALAAARDPDKDALEDQLEVGKAQLELDRNELDATSAMLEKLGADPGAKVHRLKAAFTAAQQAPAWDGAEAAYPFQPGSLLHRATMAYRLRTKAALLDQARQACLARAEGLNQRHQALNEEAERAREDREAARSRARGFSHGAPTAGGRDTAKATLTDLKQFMERQRTLADLGKRYQDEKELAGIYQNWRALVAAQEREALHGVVQRVIWILLVLILVYFADRIFEGIFRKLMAGRKRVGRNLKVVKVSAMVLGALAILLIVLGVPGQLTTLFGLAGAGLTVALKDVIISCFGWFILVGPKGIHVGDWVEINGVSGEVVEIGLMRTLLLETGNWSDAGHPTGRVASFANSFALEGHFFNFSSSGQWLWDELTVNVPASEDPYPFIEGIRALVENRTRDNTAKAFREWEQSDRGYASRGLKTEPGINIVSTGSGVQVRVRYVTSAQERNELRNSLNSAVVAMLHGRQG